MSRLMRAVFVGLIAFAAGVAYVTMPQEDGFSKMADEGQYFNYAKGVSTKGVGYIPVLLNKYMTTPTAKLFPHPGRVGHTLIMACWFHVFPKTFRSLAHLSFICYLIFLWVSFIFARKYFGADTALWYVALLSSSPLLMAASRRVLQDSLLNLFWALPFWFFFDYLAGGRKRSLWIACATAALAITIKEQSVVLIVFFAASWLIFKCHYQKDLSVRDFLVFLATVTVVPVVVEVVYLGGIGNFLTVIHFILGVHFAHGALSSYSYFGIGPWYKFLIDFMLLSPVTTLLFFGYFFQLLLHKNFDAFKAYAFVFFLIIFAVFSSLHHSKVIRFVLSLEMVMFFFALFALEGIFNFKKKYFIVIAMSISVFLIFFMNILNFQKIFVADNTYDPITVWLLLSKKILPYFLFRLGP